MSALSICIVLRAFAVVISMCLMYVSLGSRVSPSIFGLMFMGSCLSESMYVFYVIIIIIV